MQQQISRLIQKSKKIQKESDFEDFINEVLDNKKIFHFTQFLNLENINNYKKSRPKHYDLLQLFAYKDYKFYNQNKKSYPVLNERQIKKLKQLSIISLCEKSKEIQLHFVLKYLELDLIEFVKLITELSDLKLIKVKINEKENKIKVTYCVSRDIEENNIAKISQKLQELIKTNKNTIYDLNEQIKIMSIKK